MMMFLVSPCAIKYSTITSENQDFFSHKRDFTKIYPQKFVVEKKKPSLVFFWSHFTVSAVIFPQQASFLF